MDMITVGDVVFVRDAGNHAEALLQAFCKFVSCGFQRSTIE